MVVSAFIMLLLALTAVRTIEDSNSREQREKQERKEKENLDKKDRRLKEVLNWARGAASLGAEYNSDDLRNNINVHDQAPFVRGVMGKLDSGFQPLRAKSQYIIKIAESLDGEGLGNKVNIIHTNFNSLFLSTFFWQLC